MEISDEQREAFLEELGEAYRQYGRTDLPWRLLESDGSFDPYKIMVSELMLQQTQVARVIPKYHEFLQAFPTIKILAAASLGDVLRHWQGLGYNRRAKYLHEAAKNLVSKIQPWTYEELVACKGIGPNTAGAILTYTYNLPLVFVETNVRTVYIHHFFRDRSDIHDKEIIPLIKQTLDHEQPREFYWALMDYGAHLKSTVGNPNKASKHYAKQSRFEGSRRQLRGQVIRLLGARPHTSEELQAIIADDRLEAVLGELLAEAMIRKNGDMYGLE